MIQILYFGRYQDDLDTSSEQIDLPDGITDMAGLRSRLAQRNGPWQEVFGPANNHLLCSVNQQMSNAQALISDGDEIAFFPPVTGG